VALAENQENNHEILLLKQEIEALSRYPNLIMYSSQGMQAAIQAQKALSLFEPDAQFLIAYLQYNSQGAVQSSHLLMDNGNNDQPLSEERLALSDKETAKPELSANSLGNYDLSQSDIANPLFFQLSALAAARQQVLKPISQEILEVLEAENHAPQKDFHRRYLVLSKKYLDTVDESQTRIIKGIAALYKEYASMPLADFMHYIQSVGLEDFARESLKEQLDQQNPQPITSEAITQQIQKISAATDLNELEEEIIRSVGLVKLDHLPDPNQVIALQNSVKTAATERVEKFLFSPHSTLKPEALDKENRERLLRLLKAAWIRDEAEVEYYLSEFDLLMEKNSP
jgi:hypothetical protein